MPTSSALWVVVSGVPGSRTSRRRGASARSANSADPGDPLPEESLDSWLEALACRTDATWGEILRAVGIFGMQGNSASYWATRATVSLTPGQVRHHQPLHGCRTAPASGDDSSTVDQGHQLATTVGGLTARHRFAVLSDVSRRARRTVAGVVAVALGIRLPDA